MRKLIALFFAVALSLLCFGVATHICPRAAAADTISSFNGFQFDADALSLRFASECSNRGITSRAQFITIWNAATQTQQINFLARMLFGSTRFPEDAGLSAQQLAGLGVP